MNHIKNTANLGRIIDFEDLKVGNIRPTDIDAFIEYKNKAFIFIEFKCGNVLPCSAQSLAFERLCDSIKDRDAIFFICQYEDNNPENTVPAHLAKVVRYRWQGAWKSPLIDMTIGDAVKSFIVRCDEER